MLLSLMSPLLDLGNCVTVDKYYYLPELVEALIEHKTDVYGTARPGCRNMPNFATKQLQKGHTYAYQKGKCLSLLWKDKKVVTFLSMLHFVGMVDVTNKRGEVESKLLLVMEYNNTMCGVDKSDQNLSYYPCARNGQKYTKRCFAICWKGHL